MADMEEKVSAVRIESATASVHKSIDSLEGACMLVIRSGELTDALNEKFCKALNDLAFIANVLIDRRLEIISYGCTDETD